MVYILIFLIFLSKVKSEKNISCSDGRTCISYITFDEHCEVLFGDDCEPPCKIQFCELRIENNVFCDHYFCIPGPKKWPYVEGAIGSIASSCIIYIFWRIYLKIKLRIRRRNADQEPLLDDSNVTGRENEGDAISRPIIKRNPGPSNRKDDEFSIPKRESLDDDISSMQEDDDVSSNSTLQDVSERDEILVKVKRPIKLKTSFFKKKIDEIKKKEPLESRKFCKNECCKDSFHSPSIPCSAVPSSTSTIPVPVSKNSPSSCKNYSSSLPSQKKTPSTPIGGARKKDSYKTFSETASYKLPEMIRKSFKRKKNDDLGKIKNIKESTRIDKEKNKNVEEMEKIEPEKKKNAEEMEKIQQDKATMNLERSPFDMEPPKDDVILQPPENADPYYRSLFEVGANSLEDDDDDDKLNPCSNEDEQLNPFSKIFFSF